jgi:hypothetical protein
MPKAARHGESEFIATDELDIMPLLRTLPSVQGTPPNRSGLPKDVRDMSFKVDSSFLKYLTMGAAATQRVMNLMRDAGLHPVELERYASTNKIWATKVKRLRLPDLLCLRTGVRVEVRGKSKLELRMSDAPTNKDRRWHSGLQSQDLIAFVKCESTLDGQVTPASTAEFFSVSSLRRSYSHAKHGNRKSSSEGAEQDVSWPTTVATCDGEVQSVSESQIKVHLTSGRKQVYQLGTKTAYVTVGDEFQGGTQFLAGAPRDKASLPSPHGARWNPRIQLRSAIDRYVCAKALGHLGSTRDFRLLSQLENDRDHRVALEATASLAKLGQRSALERLMTTIQSPAVPYLRMEGVFILAEIQGTLATEAAKLLEAVATNPEYPDEVSQAAIWYLGHKGHQRYLRLERFLDAPTENQRLHAIAAFGLDLPSNVCKSLVGIISDENRSDTAKSAAAEVLARQRTPEKAIHHLLSMASHEAARPRLLSVLGSINADTVSSAIKDKTILDAILPVQFASKSRNWTRAPAAAESLAFLSKQVL